MTAAPSPERPQRRHPYLEAARTISAAFLWLVVAVAIAFGAAGIVAAANQPPVDGTRPELTWQADQVIEPQLRAAAGDLGALSDKVDGLGTIGRSALTAVIDQDVPAIQASIASGQASVGTIKASTDALRARLEAIRGEGTDDPTRIGSALRVQRDSMAAALSATDGLADSWTSLTRVSLVAIQLSESLTEHDTQAAAAAALARNFKYKEALATLGQASAALVVSGKLRDQLASSVDISVLTDWIDRNAAFDTAVAKVWTLLQATKTRVPPALHQALADLKTAQANLPPDARALVVIMAELARGGINEAVIDIEQARARLATAVDALQPQASPTP